MDGMDNASGAITTMNNSVSGSGVVRGFHTISYALSIGLAALDYVSHFHSFLFCSVRCLSPHEAAVVFFSHASMRLTPVTGTISVPIVLVMPTAARAETARTL